MSLGLNIEEVDTMTEGIRIYIDCLENGKPHTAAEWRRIIKADFVDFEKQDERFTRLTETEINEILAQLKNDGFVK